MDDDGVRVGSAARTERAAERSSASHPHPEALMGALPYGVSQEALLLAAPSSPSRVMEGGICTGPVISIAGDAKDSLLWSAPGSSSASDLPEGAFAATDGT